MDWLKIGGYLLIIIPTLLVGVVLGFYIIQDYLIFQGERLPRSYKFLFPNRFEEFNFITASGVELNAILFKVENSKGLVYYHHGNAGNLQVWGTMANYFNENNWDVLFYDYRGFGKSSSRISREHHLHDDAAFILTKIKEEFNYSKIVYYGNSLGTGVAAKLAMVDAPDALILETPYYSFTDLVNYHYPYLPSTYIAKYHLRTYKFLLKLECPIILFHGTDDKTVPYNSSERLSQLSESITLVKIPNGVHNNLPEFTLYRNGLKKFLERI